MNKKGKLIVVSGPSGAGKSSLIAKAMEIRSDLSFSVSVTTREARPGEKDGEDYFFVSKERMRFALIYNWSVSDEGRRMRHEAP